MTQLEKAKFGEVSPAMEQVAKQEGIKPKELLNIIAEGKAVIFKSELHNNVIPLGIGKHLRVKVNANIGSSPKKADINYELEKLKVCEEFKADTVMDLSTGGDIDAIRRAIIAKSTMPVGTVPIYQAVIEKKTIEDLSESEMLKGIIKHIQDGVDFITVHSGFTRDQIKPLRSRVMGVVSRGGSFLLKWMLHNNKENPLYENFDKIMFHAKKYDVTLSLGDGLRPGCLKDATDKAQMAELKTLGKLAKTAYDNGVQSIIEGPGHVPLDQIKINIDLQKEYCHGAPFYVLGPLVTDIAPGYDHITSAIGGALAATCGADYLCYVTPAEHLGLPTLEDVKQGIITSRIAAHAADIAKGVKNARVWDDEMSEARANLDWKKMYELAIDPKLAKKVRDECENADDEVCSMCGEFCSVKINKELRKGD
ncbi:MAG: phosphomethylpyrimidine synthase ThiC [Nanoarchaeota archaeon]|nr:phosphomethylpyrimidine synthase ThiC [Nanoarchaeota archaeon]MBU1705035.1 phosphomethylpyrimidine synthase ThiC [Nanoarchaeota archaeon]